MAALTDVEIKEFAWKTLRDNHLPVFRETILKEHGEKFFMERAEHIGNTLKNFLALLDAEGYVLTRAEFADLC